MIGHYEAGSGGPLLYKNETSINAANACYVFVVVVAVVLVVALVVVVLIVEMVL